MVAQGIYYILSLDDNIEGWCNDLDLSALVSLSNRYGRNPDYVLAGGGNTSCKEDGIVYVKGSGTRLATITADGFVPVFRSKLLETLVKSYPDSDKERESAFLKDVSDARVIPGEVRRPSVEALLHAIFPQKYVLHVHPSKVNGLTCSVNGEKDVQRLFGDSVIWVPLCRPGLILGKLCNDAMNVYKAKTGKDADAILLQNHGIFVAADSVEGIDRRYSEIYDAISGAISREPDFTPEDVAVPGELAELRSLTGFSNAKFISFRELLRFAADENAAAPILRPFTPDHIVVCGAYPAFFDGKADGDALRGKRIVICKGKGAVILGETPERMESVEALFRDTVKIAVYSEAFGGALPMTADMIDFITHWEAESYRQKKL